MIASESTINEAQYQELFRNFAGALRDHLDITGQIDEAKVREIAQEAVDAARLPREITVSTPDGKSVHLEGRTHVQFEQLLKVIDEGHRNLLMVGPAGSGKTTLAKNVAEALDLDFGFISLSAGVTETHLFGRMLPKADGTWGYVESVFVRVYRNGGIYLLDELDAADANVMVSVNAALANGCLCNPVTGEVVERHKDCYIIGAANTWGRGGDSQYVGRNALDAATMDRFVLTTLHIEYDTDLELELVRARLDPDKTRELLTWVTRLREKITDNRLRRIASTRLVVSAAAAMAAGVELADVKRRYFVDWSKDELAKVEEV